MDDSPPHAAIIDAAYWELFECLCDILFVGNEPEGKCWDCEHKERCGDMATYLLGGEPNEV